MARRFYQDPTEFFSVVGPAFVHEQHSVERFAEDVCPRKFEIGMVSIYAACCAVALGASVFSNNSAGHLVHVAYNVMR
jgi:hypothetical protein